MLSVELKVNGALVGHIYGRNIQGDTISKYKYEYYEPESRKFIKGTVTHRRSEGLRNLISIILNDMEVKDAV